VITEISEETIKEALNSLSWDDLSDHLSNIQLTSDQVDKLLGLVKRSEALIQKRNAPNKEKKRDKLLECLAVVLEEKAHVEAATRVRSYATMFRIVDGCYQGILDLLKKCDAADFAPEKRVSALLARSGREYVNLIKNCLSAADQGVMEYGTRTLKNDEGQNFSIEAIHEGLVDALGSTIGMEAYINQWFDDKGTIVLPSLPSTTDQDNYIIGSVQLLALSWRNWQRAERRHRYLDGVLKEHTEGLGPDYFDKGVARLLECSPSNDLEKYDFIANARLDERLKQLLINLSFNRKVEQKVVGIESSAHLLPEQAVSVSEIHGAVALSQLLSSDINSDYDEFAGLRLVEWIRGYAVLQCISETSRNLDSPDSLSIRFDETELVCLMQRLGLAGNKACLFIEWATFRRESRDLFDQPLLRLQDGSLVLVGLAAEHSSLPRSVLSTLAMLKVNLDGRGKNFERYIIGFLKKHGLDAKGIRCKRAGEEYDYDVAFVWGDYLFLLECKSRSLSGNDPIGAYYFSLGVNSVLNQVNRLADGLCKHPDILEEYMPEAVGKQVVFCVMNSLPYSIIGGIDGIYFTDESSFGRFFIEPQFGERKVGRKEGFGGIEPGNVFTSLWRDPKPTPEDLLRHLEKPIQVIISKAHTELSPAWARLGEDTVGMLMEFGQVNLTRESMRDAIRETGFDVPQV